MSSTVTPTPVAASTAGPQPAAPAAPTGTVPGESDTTVDATPAGTAAAFQGTVVPLLVAKPASGHANVTGGTPRRSDAASGWATTRNAAAARDLLHGDLVGAYGLVNSGPAGQGDYVVSPSPLASSKPNGGDARHRRSATTTASSNSGSLDRTTHGARGPEGGMQSSSGGGGAASPMVRATRIGLVALPQVRFAAGPVLRLAGTQARRLERPG
jgi:hypothetical protein